MRVSDDFDDALDMQPSSVSVDDTDNTELAELLLELTPLERPQALKHFAALAARLTK